MDHELKTIGRYFDAVKAGTKTFEVRKNDRAVAEAADGVEQVKKEVG